jgi:hypothetical protein
MMHRLFRSTALAGLLAVGTPAACALHLSAGAEIPDLLLSADVSAWKAAAEPDATVDVQPLNVSDAFGPPLVSPVPEPACPSLFVVGLVAVLWVRSRRMRDDDR